MDIFVILNYVIIILWTKKNSDFLVNALNGCVVGRCNTEPLIDPEKMNPFLDSLIDPFKNREDKTNKNFHLETLWFQSGEQEWLDDREQSDYYDRAIHEMEEGRAKKAIDMES